MHQPLHVELRVVARPEMSVDGLMLARRLDPLVRRLGATVASYERLDCDSLQWLSSTPEFGLSAGRPVVVAVDDGRANLRFALTTPADEAGFENACIAALSTQLSHPTGLEQLARRLLERSLTVSVAESCTGGLLGASLSRLSGSSGYFLGGAQTYSNGEKKRAIGVSEALLTRHGAVSEAVAVAMAEGIRRATGSTHALSITGIAGPGGGSVAKPVGSVWMALAAPSGTQARLFHFGGAPRELVRRCAVDSALGLLFDALDGASP